MFTLTKALEVERSHRSIQHVDAISQQANRLKPFDVPKNPGWLLKATNTKDEDLSQDQAEQRAHLQELSKKIHSTKVQYLIALAEGGITPLGSGKNAVTTLAQHAEREARLGQLREQSFKLQDAIRNLVAKVRPEHHIKTHLREFPHPLFTKVTSLQISIQFPLFSFI